MHMEKQMRNLNKALFCVRFEKSPPSSPPPPNYKRKQDSHTFCFLAKILNFGSQHFPANRVPDFPRKQTNQKVPSYSRTAKETHSLDLKSVVVCVCVLGEVLH